MSNRTKGEQFFILVMMCIGVFGLFALTGCGGGKSCEMIKCGSEDFLGGTVTGISIPGCGGCLSSGKGCNSCLWAQSCKVSCGKWEEEGKDDEGEDAAFHSSIKGCDTRYYGGGCLGCYQDEKSCYSGCMDINTDSSKFKGFFYGSTDGGEKFVGCSNGCGGCIADDNIGGSTLYELEHVEGID